MPSSEIKAVSQNQRSTPMQVLCLGLCRTGTQSLANALPMLGYGPIYHMREVYKNGHGPNWVSALNAKYGGEGKLFGKEEFEQFLGDFAGVSDIPASLFITEFMDSYPGAKIILTTREEEKWLASMRNNIWDGYNTGVQLSPVAELMRKYVWDFDPEPEGIRKFREHNQKVLEEAKKRGRDVLIFEVKQGWGPLCEFLGRKAPEGEEFPNSDDARQK